MTVLTHVKHFVIVVRSQPLYQGQPHTTLSNRPLFGRHTKQVLVVLCSLWISVSFTCLSGMDHGIYA